VWGGGEQEITVMNLRLIFTIGEKEGTCLCCKGDFAEKNF
jgi:hypothetical protein